MMWKEEHLEAFGDESGKVEWTKFNELQTENAELKRNIEFLGEISAFFAAKQQSTMT